MQNAAALVAVHGAQLSPPQWEVAIAALARAEDLNVERAAHRLRVVLLPFHFHRRKHAVRVELQVPARLPELRPADMRRIDELVTAVVMRLPPEVLDNRPQPAALRVPQDEPRSHILADREEV